MNSDVAILADEARHLKTCIERDAERLRLLSLAIAGLAAQGHPGCAASAAPDAATAAKAEEVLRQEILPRLSGLKRLLAPLSPAARQALRTRLQLGEETSPASRLAALCGL